MSKSVPLAILGLMVVACSPAASLSNPTSAPGTPTGATVESATASAPIHLKVGFYGYLSFAPIYIAKAEGYFAAEGLDVELVNMRPSSETAIPALVRGDLDVAGIGFQAAEFNAINEGIDIKIVADKGFMDPQNCPTDAWVASKQALQSGLVDTPSLRGRTVSIQDTGGPISYTLNRILEGSGVTIADLSPAHVAEPAARVEALRTGALDLAPLSEPWITIARQSGAGEVWKRYSDAAPGLSLGNIVYGRKLLAGDREAGVRFMVGYLRAVRQFNEGKTDRNVALIAEYTKLAPDLVRAACWTSYRSDGRVDTQALLEYQQWLIDRGNIDKPVAVDRFWTDEFVKEANARLSQ